MSKRHFIILPIIALFLIACGQKGALYLPEKNSSDIPVKTTDNSGNRSANPTDFNNVQNSTTLDPIIKPNADY